MRKKILELTKEYYKKHLTKSQETIHCAGRVFDERELVNLIDSSLDFWLTYGRYSIEFEEKLADFLGVKYALFVNSGSSANLLAFMALTCGSHKIKRGDEVITVAAAFPTTVAPIVQYGAVPVFVDVDLDTANIDVSQLEKALTPRTRAVMLAHTLGNPFDVKSVLDFCDDNKLWLIEDNCDALGSRYDGKLTGTFGDIGTSSFFPAHHITTGEGGAVYTNDPALHKIMLSMRDWGRDCQCPTGKDNTCGKRFSQQFGLLPDGYDHKYVYSNFGYNFKATDMQAAIGCAQLDKLSDFIEKRKKNWRKLYDGIHNVRGLSPMHPTSGSDPSWFGFMMTVAEDASFTRGRIVKHLEKKGIQTRMMFAGNLIKHPCFDADVRYVVGDLTNTDTIMNNSFWIGVYPGLTDKDITYMIDAIRGFA